MEENKIKTRQGSGYLKQLYSTARVTAGSTHSNLKNLTTFLVNFVPTDKVDASELQVRTHFDDEEIQALSYSIKEHGVLQPILVVQDGDRYKVIAGERRLRASKLAGIDRIPARVITSTDKGTHEIALRENLDRVDLHPLEEGEGYLSLLEAKAYSSYDAIAKAFGKPKSRITECIGFTRLPDETKQELMARNLKSRQILRQLLKTPPQMHKDLIIEAAKKEMAEALNEEQIQAALLSQHSEGTDAAAKTKEKKKKEIPVFAYQVQDAGVAIPGFKWKVGEGPEKIRAFINSLYQLIQDIESKHLEVKTSPSSNQPEADQLFSD